MGSVDPSSALDQVAARGPGQRAERNLAPPAMKARLAVALHALSVRRGVKWVLHDITWRLEPGERWALLGENGAGKTQLLKILSGDVWPTPTRGGVARRTYLARGYPVALLDPKPRMASSRSERQRKDSRYACKLCVPCAVPAEPRPT